MRRDFLSLKFSENFDDFLPYVEVRHEGIMMKSFQPLIYAVDAENITIKGEGTLDGQGKAWWTEFFRVLVDLRDNGKRNITGSKNPESGWLGRHG